MANGKRTGQESRPVLGVKAKEAKTPKEMAKALFEGEAGAINSEAANDPPAPRPSMEVVADIPLPNSDEPDSTVQAAAEKIEALFAAVGTDLFPETVIPVPPGKNNGAEARDFVVAELLVKAAERRFKKAKEAATATGVFGDPEKYSAGKTITVFNSPGFSFSVKRDEDSSLVNRELVMEQLKVNLPKKWQDVYPLCLKPKAGAVRIITSLK